MGSTHTQPYDVVLLLTGCKCLRSTECVQLSNVVTDRYRMVDYLEVKTVESLLEPVERYLALFKGSD